MYGLDGGPGQVIGFEELLMWDGFGSGGPDATVPAGNGRPSSLQISAIACKILQTFHKLLWCKGLRRPVPGWRWLWRAMLCRWAVCPDVPI